MKTRFTAVAHADIFLPGTGLTTGAGNVSMENVFETRPLGIQMSTKMAGPLHGAGLQIISLTNPYCSATK
jgi:hypothetical protein